jgi:hypothetical protein
MKAIYPALIASLVLSQAATTTSYFPIRMNSASEGITAFEAKWYGKSLARMKEPPLPEAAKDGNLVIFRLTILPTWGNPITVRVQEQTPTYELFARRLDGMGGYDPGKLVEAKEVMLSPDDSERFNTLIERLNFYQMPSEEVDRANGKTIGLDGDEWILEGVSRGRYHVIERWCASSFDVKKRGLRPFLALCKFLLDKSTLKERPKNKGHRLL